MFYMNSHISLDPENGIWELSVIACKTDNSKGYHSLEDNFTSFTFEDVM